jgi:hypothetical protein
MEKELERVKSNITGSRLGFISAGLMVDGIPAPIYYDKNYYDPDLYWCTQDAYWSRPLSPKVNVGDLEQVRDSGDNATTKPKN